MRFNCRFLMLYLFMCFVIQSGEVKQFPPRIKDAWDRLDRFQNVVISQKEYSQLIHPFCSSYFFKEYKDNCIIDLYLKVFRRIKTYKNIYNDEMKSIVFYEKRLSDEHCHKILRFKMPFYRKYYSFGFAHNCILKYQIPKMNGAKKVSIAVENSTEVD